jgi:glycosyltransferase involved in cell wall biosynthesis
VTSGPSVSPPAGRRPPVAIGMPVYNSERYLEQAIESLLAQTYGDFELILCDNASTDETRDICERYARQDRRVRYHRNHANIGMNPNFNRVFRLSDSRYFKWSTADDYWAPEMVADGVEALERNGSVVLAYPRAVLVDADGREQTRYEDELNLMQDDPAERFRFLLLRMELCNHHLGVLRSSAIRRTRLFAPHTGADVCFLAEMSLYGKFQEIPKYQFFRRFHEDSSSWKRSDEEHQAGRFYSADGPQAFPSARCDAQNMRSVLRAPLPPGKKLGLAWWVAKSVYWHRRELGRELRHVPLLFRRSRRSAGAPKAGSK